MSELHPSPLLAQRWPQGGGLPAVLDMEASGFGRNSYPIEIGYVLPDGRSFCTLIQPAPGWQHWDPEAEKVHHISRDATLRHGRAVGEVAAWLNDQLAGMTVYSDGWANDYSWMGKLFDAADSTPRFKMDSLRGLLTEPEAASWHGLKQAVGLEPRLPRHRASADARLLQSTLGRLRAPLPPAGGLAPQVR